MSDQKPGYGTQETVDGAPALRFVRTLPYSQQRIWQAAATPSELEQWFPAAVEWGPETGETLEAYGMTGEVIEAQEPNLLVWTFNGDGFRFEITGDEEATQLTFVHIFGDPATPAAQTATGWHTYLDRLEPVLEGHPISEEAAHAGWGDLHEEYAELFEDDPTPGREFWAKLQKQLNL
ncbi:hypothetical protein HGQ17_11110 [Nesterenkonia sp. MY13]|uniref:Activator of Hsp90 ATPase homologue 1/2-like C-terminal domain-containing protein n=1 Tax=Nesterenkonia sedimenti TaxID=1463632 RepID=A0A7X8TM38_9MICC|nr:SRPBCC domain-containing protein [Nesterenkonia sedimenti]NLS10528.1 hypothetical protein [Nesterenkonia sedimenti]